MDQPLFLLLIFSGLSILPSCLPHKFHFVNMSKNWTEAQSICRQNFTDLATIDDMAEINMLNTTFIASWRGSLWIGLYNNSWRWSLGDSELEGNGFWSQGQPNDDTQIIESCVYMILNGSWYNQECNNILKFVCSDDQNGTNKYILIAELKTWSQAQSYCRENHTDLASVRNQTEKEAIKVILSNITGIDKVWIGLNKVWRWSDQSGSSYRNWGLNEPNGAGVGKPKGEFCVVVTSSGLWNDEGCQNTNTFICYDDELVLVKENKTWSEALLHCRDRNMELVSAHNESIQHWVRQRAKKASTPFVWLGLRYTCTLDFWFWVNGEESCYHNWAGGESYNTSKEKCGNTGAIQRDRGQWVGQSETERFNFICSKSDDY